MKDIWESPSLGMKGEPIEPKYVDNIFGHVEPTLAERIAEASDESGASSAIKCGAIIALCVVVTVIFGAAAIALNNMWHTGLVVCMGGGSGTCTRYDDYTILHEDFQTGSLYLYSNGQYIRFHNVSWRLE